MPDAVVVRLGLAAGVELNRPLLRRLRRELARARAQTVAGRALARRELTSAELERRLERARVADEARADVVAGLERSGLVDDARAARARAELLAGRGYGDAAISARLEEAGVDPGDVAAALEAIDPEHDRARALIAWERDPARAARLLARRGFDPDLVEELAGALDSATGDGLG